MPLLAFDSRFYGHLFAADTSRILHTYAGRHIRALEVQMVHTVSVDTARQLKAAGFPQETEFWWINTSHRVTADGKRINYYNRLGYKTDLDHLASLHEDLAAPIAEEILQTLPGAFGRDNSIHIPTFIKDDAIYMAFFTSDDSSDTLPSFREHTLAEALAQMWLFMRHFRQSLSD